MVDKIWIFDTTLRDGEQSPGYSMTLEGKLKMAAMLEDMGVDIIEAGFPAASKGDFESVFKVAEQSKNSIITGLCRAVHKDIDAVAEAIKPARRKRIHTFLSTSPLHMKHKLQVEPKDVLEMVKESVSYARNLCDDVEWSAEDATRTEHDFLCATVEAAIDAGARTINIPDTVGYTIPEEYFALIEMLMQRVPNIDKAILSAHCHNDLGLAVSNSIAAVQAGARQIECTINGIGERAGNASLEEIVMAFRTRHDKLPFETSIETTKLLAASQLLTEVTGFSVQPNKAIVGDNAFAHESGIHQDGMLKHAGTYEIMTPESVGRRQTDLVLGKHSGRNAFRTKLSALGFDLESDDLNEAFTHFKSLADRKKKITDDDLILIVKTKKAILKEIISFVSLSVSARSFGQQEATLELEIKGEKKKGTASGEKGPVDACFKVIRDLVLHDGCELHSYSSKSLAEGSDASTEVHVQLLKDGQVFNGEGVDTDVIVASCRSYIDALNKLVGAQYVRL